MSTGNQSGHAAQWARDRCEVCNRVISEPSDQRERRCADHVQDLALFPASACKKKRHSRGGDR